MVLSMRSFLVMISFPDSAAEARVRLFDVLTMPRMASGACDQDHALAHPSPPVAHAAPSAQGSVLSGSWRFHRSATGPRLGQMTRDEFNVFCRDLPSTTHVVQWGGADVWKVGGKVFAICGWSDRDDAYTFKVSELAFEILRERPGVRPAPYLASRGFKWLQHYKHPGLTDDQLREHIVASWRMIASALPKKAQAALDLTLNEQAAERPRIC